MDCDGVAKSKEALSLFLSLRACVCRVCGLLINFVS